MATRKSPARGTTRRPAKASAATGRSRTAAKKPLEVSTKDTVAEPQNNVVSLPSAEAAAVVPEAVVEAAPVVEDTVVVVDAPVAIDEPAPADEVVETVAEEPEVEIEVEPIQEPEVEMTFNPSQFPGASLFAGFPQFPSFGAVDMNAFAASGAVFAEGMQNLGSEMMAFSQKAVERNVETTMKMLTASSVEEVMDLQSRHAMGSMDDMMTGGAKLTGMAMEVASKAASPFTRS